MEDLAGLSVLNVLINLGAAAACADAPPVTHTHPLPPSFCFRPFLPACLPVHPPICLPAKRALRSWGLCPSSAASARNGQEARHQGRQDRVLVVLCLIDKLALSNERNAHADCSSKSTRLELSA